MAQDVLSKGANVSLLHRSAVDEGRLHAVVRWSDPSEAAADVDVAALLLGQDGRVRSDEDFVFYNAPTGGDGAVRLMGKRAQDAVSEDRVSVDLEALPPEIRTIVIVASLDATEGVGFADIPDLTLDLLDGAGEPRVRFEVAAAGSETAMVLGELYLRGDEWKFRAVGQGWDSGLAGLAGDYGIDVADPADDDADVGPAPGVNGGAAPAEFGDAVAVGIGILPESQTGADLVELPPSVDAAEVSASAAVDQAPSNGGPSTQARAARSRTGVRTRKKRATAATLPPLTLAVDPSWQPARLFSVTGVGNTDEQERRATSTLLSTMMAVRDFGRALVARFGGPAGSIETYLEVPFTLDERTSIPDGVIRVARAGRVWTALLEVKTGTSPLRNEQVERYLDLARQQGYDAVITLSNDLAPVGGMHPIAVDGRKLRKVALHHISWSEVLHEAQMQLAHRGVDDRLQAWLLAELIRYLEHPRSGAAGFDDMGMAWVPIREAVAANTLRATDRKIGAVTTSWEKLVRHVSLTMTSQLGVNVTPVLPRKLARDHAARAQAAAAELAASGTLSATLRIPGAAGPVTMVADLRTGQIRTSIEVDAPREGGSSRRINWMLRQLTDAPDALTVEVLFARRDQTSCEQLKDVRANLAVLLPDAGAELRGFRLMSLAPMGTKRNGLRKAFVPSVNDAVEAFYAQVVQGLRPTPPKMSAEAAAEAINAVDRAVDAG
ncbi:TerD family protein [Pseudonocardia sp. MH-G8]|uniref:TerD family protein n=1 Tax=Pseudonocardia sp. MH-G8 TaxID=1854588 RepID=UPI001304518C|nr:TerD family protein [Pseudonocardia sp. MH-G8]